MKAATGTLYSQIPGKPDGNKYQMSMTNDDKCERTLKNEGREGERNNQIPFLIFAKTGVLQDNSKKDVVKFSRNFVAAKIVLNSPKNANFRTKLFY